MLRLNCFFKANEGGYAPALEAAQAPPLAPRPDAGSAPYDVSDRATNPGVFMICETWTDAEALKVHMAAPHFEKYVGALQQLGALKLEQSDFPAK